VKDAPETTVGTLSAGLERDEHDQIKNSALVFKPSDRHIVFNAQIENVKGEVPVVAFWKFGDDKNYFTSYSVTASPNLDLAKFELNKESDWPVGQYMMVVKVGDETNGDARALQFEIKE
jgi:hypothetical protein